MDNTKNQKDEGFALYTEKIVPKPAVKYRRLISGVKFVLAAVLFGVIASFVMLFLYPVLEQAVQKKAPKEVWTIEKDEYPSEVESTSEEIEQTVSEEDTERASAAEDSGAAPTLKSAASDILKSLVTIDVYKTEMGNILTETQSATETVGVVIGQTNGEYIILTNAAMVSESSSLVVKISKATEVGGVLRGSSGDMGIAVIV